MADDRTTLPGEEKLSDEEYARRLVERYEGFRQKLEEAYWPNFRKNRDAYAAHDPARPNSYATGSATAIVESTVNRVVAATRTVATEVRGPVSRINRGSQETVESLVDSLVDDADIAERHGTWRSVKEQLTRDLLVVGNCVAEEQYEYALTTLPDGTARVEANGTYCVPCQYQDYAFNPAYDWNSSPEKFLRKFASFEDLWENRYREWEEEELREQETVDPVTGQPVVAQVPVKVKKSAGIYKNLDKLREQAAKDGAIRHKPYSGGDSGQHDGDGGIAEEWVEDVELLVCWKGARLCVVANGSVIVREEYDPFGTGKSNLRTAMFIKETGRPVGWSLMDRMRGLVQIKDDSLNDRKALLERALKVGGVYDETDPARLRAIATVILKGGIAPGQPGKWEQLNPVNPGVASALLSPAELQQELERSALFSPYAAGQVSQETDKTAGTAAGINSIIGADEPNLEVVIDRVAEQLEWPHVRFCLQAMAHATADGDVRWLARSGGSKEAVGITKRFLQGRPTGEDLVLAGIVTPEQLSEYGVPATETYLDADLVIRVGLNPQGASEKYQKAQAEKALVDQSVQLGLPVDVQKAYVRIATKLGFEDFEDYFLSEEQVAQQQARAQAEAQEQFQMEQQAAENDHQRKLELLNQTARNEAALAAPEALLSGQPALA